jgi:hypothetical protein
VTATIGDRPGSADGREGPAPTFEPDAEDTPPPDDAQGVADTSAGRWWMLSILLTAILLVVLLTLWVRQDRHDESTDQGLVDHAAVDDFLETAGAPGADADRIHLATGVFIQSLAFQGPYDVRLTGYVWHRFPGDVRASVGDGSSANTVPVVDPHGNTVPVELGFIFPEQVDSAFTTTLRAVTYDADFHAVSGPPPQQAPTTSPTAPPSPAPPAPTSVPAATTTTQPVADPAAIATTTPAVVPPSNETLPTFLLRSPSASGARNAQPIPDVSDPRAPGSTTVLYYFEAPVRQPFEYDVYPFDHKVVWLRIWPAEFEANIVLVPDFDSYPCQVQPTMNCTGEDDIFGIDNSIELGEFSRENTYFDYHQDPFYNSNLGSPKFHESDFPELRFNVLIRREVGNAFVTNLVPLFVAAGLAFGILMTMTRDERRSRRFGFSTTLVMTTLAALFFAVLLAHQHLRGQFQGVVYFEYFYFLMYLVLLGVAVTAILISAPATRDRTLFAFGDNLLPQVIFWPSLLLAMVVVTVVAL